ncbi:hypothetical protein QWZ14_21340 [Paeniroseomonas aquatica]|uniref:Glycosyltransferase family 1 protein n=2 Tax=Paeniroseomonas aquatica TaxID=373043 RepID=A0ABT8AAY7_9PROT|nr:hypothetical protein [Paeniroseomonas aquatica]MDN3566931.1 hypothetical protein [Paeniroseomonas aquatica]
MSGRQPRALLANAEFAVVAGSELVLLELAEELLGRGWACDLLAWSMADPMQAMARQAGLGLLHDPAAARPLGYDLVWIQNRMEAVMDYAPAPEEAPRTLFAFAHLDRDWSFAQPGVVAEGLLGGAFLVTSERAVERVAAGGLPHGRIRMFRNAAPAAFEQPAPPPAAAPARILLVSNHAPPELLEACALLRAAGVAVSHRGLGGDVRDSRVTPADLAWADAVVSIGKTVPYALRSRRAAYVYDHFGGPGWLLDANFAAVAERNFSGLCCGRRLEAAAIQAEIMTGYPAAAAAAASHAPGRLEAFRLEGIVDAVLALAAAAPTPDQHRAALAPHAVMLQAERNLAHAAGSAFANWRFAHRALDASRAASS